jgi:tetratricopeptide (TPR) repeat protein
MHLFEAKKVTKALLSATAALLFAVALPGNEVARQQTLDAAKQAFETGEYQRAISVLERAAAADPKNGEVQLWLARSHYELEQYDLAVKSAEHAVAIEPNNSRYHEWLGRALGDKAERSSFLSALGTAKRARKEFETAVQLDEHNLAALQALIEYDCSAPGIAGGGEDKAQAEIARITTLDAIEGHYALGNCRRQKKDFATADAEFTKALEGHPKSADLIYDIGDYAMRHDKPEQLEAVVLEGERAAPGDPRGKFYRAVSLVVHKQEPDEAERLLQDYLKTAPVRSNYPRPGTVHVWLARLCENRGDNHAALKELETAVKVDPRNKFAQEALKKAKKAE